MIISGAGFSLGMSLIHSDYPIGVQLVTWLVLLFVLVIPVVVLELGTGAIYQDSLAESCRKAAKWSEVFGWLGAVVALIGMVLVTQLLGIFSHHAWDSALAALANQPNPWTAHSALFIAAREQNNVLPIALILAFLNFSLWRGAPVIARLSTVLGALGVTGMVIIFSLLVLRPGAVSGLASIFNPGDHGWSSLLSLQPWCWSAGMLIVSFACGCGVFTAYGSYLNRSGDAIGLGVCTVFLAAFAQIFLGIIFALGQTLIHPGRVEAVDATASPAFAVASALANGGWPAWGSGILVALWFILLSGFCVMALLGLLEATISPLVDKFKIGRERVIPGLFLCVFFICAFLGVHNELSVWSVNGWKMALILAAMCHIAVAWRALKFEAIARHLNAYSAFRLRWGWRVNVAGCVPLSYLMVFIWYIGNQESWWLSTSLMVGAACISALFITRLKGKGV
jgi:SNF family Na+-dependent transporter